MRETSKGKIIKQRENNLDEVEIMQRMEELKKRN